jgi:uncharacterized protein
MEQVRYKQRDCTDEKKIETFLQQTRIGVIGMASEPYPYVVPVNFVWHNGCVYFHGMGSGKKNEILEKNPQVCFTVYEELGTVTDPVPCHADTAYMSVMIFGKVEKLTNFEEAAEALQKLVEKYMPDYYSHSLTGKLIEKYRSSKDGNAVSVYRLIRHELTAKENSEEPDKLFKVQKNVP